MKRLLLIFLVACGSTPPPRVPPVPKPEPRDSVIVIPKPEPEPQQEYDTIPVIILYSDTLLRTGIYGVAAMDGYEVVQNSDTIQRPLWLTSDTIKPYAYIQTFIPAQIITYLDTEKEPIYKSYMVWQTRRR